MKRLHILLPGPAGDAPSLGKLLARGHRGAPSTPALTTTLTRLFALENTAIAPLLLAAEGIEPGSGQWFRADPVHLLAGMHSLSLLDSRRFHLDTTEANTFVTALNTHFSGELEFLAPHPTRWYARFHQPFEVMAPPLDQIVGTALDPALIAGPDATRLHGILMEIQMRLHDHPLNDTRDERGELPVNGLWFWGSGPYRQPSGAFDQVLSNDFTATALARAAGISSQQLPEHYTPAEGRILIVLEATTPAESFDDNWFGPILSALKKRQLDEVILEMTDPDGGQFFLNPKRAWQFWRQPG
jgi:hypothetical protein